MKPFNVMIKCYFTTSACGSDPLETQTSKQVNPELFLEHLLIIPLCTFNYCFRALNVERQNYEQALYLES